MKNRSLLCLWVLLALATNCQAQQPESKTDLFLLELVPSDLLQGKQLMTVFDPNGDGRITAEEMSPLGEIAIAGDLAQYDGNQDGVITMEEVEKVVAQSRKVKGYIEEDFQQAMTMMRRHDENRSKFIEEQELFDSPTEGQLSKSIFKSADLNQDGGIEFDELAKYLAAERKKK